MVLEAGKGFLGGQVETKSGDVEASLGGASLEVYAESISGDVELDGETAGDRMPRRLKGIAGSGGACLVLRSVSGDVEADWD